MPEIIVIDTKHPEESKTINLLWSTQVTEELIIGRDTSCRIVLNDKLVSRRHGKFILRNNNFYYCDLDSRNGSKINNKITKPHQEYLLKPLDTVILGNHLLWIKAILGVVSSSASAPNPIPTNIPRGSSDPTSEEKFSSDEISSESEEEPLVLNELHDNASENFTGILTETSMPFPISSSWDEEEDDDENLSIGDSSNIEPCADYDNATESNLISTSPTPASVPEANIKLPNLNNQVNDQNYLVCNNCSHHNPINGKFCTKCGSKLVK